MLIKDRKGPPIHIIPACDIQNIALNGVLPNMHIIFVDTGVPLSRRQANGVYAKIGVHLMKGWVRVTQWWRNFWRKTTNKTWSRR